MRTAFNQFVRLGGAMVAMSIGVIFAGAPCLLAANFGLTPVRVDLTAKRPNAVIQLDNMSEEPVLIQAHIATWSVEGAVETYNDTDDILLNPPIFSLEPHQKQFIRLGLRHGNEGGVERSYRLILEQVPEKPKPGVSGLTTILRMSVPVFVVPRVKVSPEVTWRAERTANGIKIIGVNSGSAHLQLTRFELNETGAPSAPVSRIMTDYLLPGQTKGWEFDNEVLQQAHEVAFRAKTDSGEIHEALVPVQP